MSTPSNSHETVERLKHLLFDQESRELDTLSSRIADMQKRAGSDENFRHAVTQVIEQVIADAGKERPREVAAAMSPMVLRTLRSEMNSPDMQDRIAGIMYPRMGEMVRRYVASAMRDMMQEINRRLEGSFGQSGFFLWLTSVATGRSMAEIAMAATQRLDVVEIHLVRRGSGALVHRWQKAGLEPAVQPAPAKAPSRGGNRDALVSGFLAAITALAEEAFEADKESLRTLDLDDHKIYLRGSPDYLLAAKCKGSAPAGVDLILDQELLRVLDEHQRIERANIDAPEADRAAAYDRLLTECAGNIEQRLVVRTRQISQGHTSQVVKLLAVMLALPLLTFGAWYGYTSWVTRSIETRAAEALATIPGLKGYPMTTHVERGGERIWITGLVPDDATRKLVLVRLQSIAPELKVGEAISVLPRPDVDARVSAETLKRASERVSSKLEALSADLGAAQERASEDGEWDAIKASEAAVRGALAGLTRSDPGDAVAAPSPALLRSIQTLKGSMERLGALVDSEVPLRLTEPVTTTDAIDVLALVTERIGVLVAALDQSRRVAPLARRVDTVDRRTELRIAALGEQTEQRVTAIDRRLVDKIAELERRLEEMRPPAPGPLVRLQAFIRDHALFFGNDVEYRDRAQSAATLDQLAALARESNALLRVVGYTDDQGSPARNLPLAQARADRVAADLVQLGVPREQLVAVGRANAFNLAPGTGAVSPNRRVEIEIGFAGERGSAP